MISDTFRAAKLLIVDDEPANVRLMEQLLERAGYTDLQSTTDAREVLPLYARCRPDLILLDLRMPHLGGLEILERLQQLKQQAASETYLPVLVLTADTAPESKRRALAAGASDFVTKPFDQIELLLRIHNLLEMRFLHRSCGAGTRASRRRSRRGATGSWRRKSWRRWATSSPASPTS